MPERAIAPVDPRSLPIPALVRWIVDEQHGPLRRAFAALVPLAAQVAEVHGARHPHLVDVHRLLVTLSSATRSHMDFEERHVFPFLAAGALPPDQAAGVRDEHVAMGQLLERLRAASAGYGAPDWACISHRTLLDGLAALEADLLAHLRLEDEALLDGAAHP